jgi:hypothetical protein
MKNPFKTTFMRGNFEDAIRQYELRHRNFFNLHGQPHRQNGFASPFWRGFFGEPMTCIPTGTAAHAYYRAGKALGNNENRALWKYDGHRSLVPGLNAAAASRNK